MSATILFRTEASSTKGVGSGHLFRCITIARILEKNFGIKKKEITFLIKINKKDKLIKKIIKKLNYEFKELSNRDNEYKKIKSLKSDFLIVDKYKFFNIDIYSKLKKNFKKIILIDAFINNDKNLVYINPYIWNQKNKVNNVPIMPSLLENHVNKKIKNKIKNIFLFFGNNNHSNIILFKCIKLLKYLDNKFIFFIDKNLKKKIKKNKKKFIFFDKGNFYYHLKKSDIAITSGGVIMSDAINLNIPLIVIPQINHQLINSREFKKKKCLLNITTNKNFKYNFIKTFKKLELKKERIRMVTCQRKTFSRYKTQKIIRILNEVLKKN
jgi:spore coat polysaccharide biosynthesis predicted glycosyltransferase SpsG